MSYNFENAIAITKNVLATQYWDVNGRTSRSDFWHYQSIMLIIGFVTGFIGGLVDLSILNIILMLAVFAPNICIIIRRMHDIEHAWWYGLIPFCNFYLACQPGTKGTNQFGEDPLGDATDIFN